MIVCGRALDRSQPSSELQCQNKAKISAMYQFRLLLSSALGLRLWFLASFLHHVFPLNAAPSPLGSPYCDGVYGFPVHSDCTKVLSKLPQDEAVHFFAEQQLRTVAPRADWPPFEDPRPWKQQQSVVQIPKWWSHGKDASILPECPSRYRSSSTALYKVTKLILQAHVTSPCSATSSPELRHMLCHGRK